MDKQIILVVDDTPENIDVMSGILRADYKVKAALSGEKALKIAQTVPAPDIILLDVMMPDMDGYEVCRQLKNNPQTRDIPVIFVTAKDAESDETFGLDLGAVDYLAKPISPAIVQARIKTHLSLYDQNRHLEKTVQDRTKDLVQTQLQIIQRLGRAAEFKDNETGLHVIRMSHYSRLLAQALNLSDDYVDLIFKAAPMHDVGKIGIPDSVLLKPGKLDDQEWQLMRQHPQFGGDIIGDHESELLKEARIIALAHHEKWDGSGYPNKLVGEDIPLSARIVAVADVFDALTTERPYKDAWSVEEAVALIDRESGNHFDPRIVMAFHEVLPDILDIREEYAETNR